MYQFKPSTHSHQHFQSSEESFESSKRAFTAYCDVLRSDIENTSGQSLKRCKFRHFVISCFNRVELGGLLWLETIDDTFKSEAAFLKSLQVTTTYYEYYTVGFKNRFIQLLSLKYGIKISDEAFMRAESLAMEKLYWDDEAFVNSILSIDDCGC